MTSPRSARRQFYVTNDHGSRTEFGRTMETYLTLPRANVLYFDGMIFREAAVRARLRQRHQRLARRRAYLCRRIHRAARADVQARCVHRQAHRRERVRVPVRSRHIDVGERRRSVDRGASQAVRSRGLCERSLQAVADRDLPCARRRRHPAIGRAGLRQSGDARSARAASARRRGRTSSSARSSIRRSWNAGFR